MMLKLSISARSVVVVALAATVALPTSASAQATAKPVAKKSSAGNASAGLKAELVSDMADVEKKYMQLAGAMTGKFSWRPAEKVRSVSEVLMHISGENYALPVVLGVKAPSDFAAGSLQEAFESASAMERVTDEVEVKAAMEKSFAHMRQALQSVPESEMSREISVFGQKMTKRAFMVLIVGQMHEHLGQTIAYARMNGVTPPWSTAGGG